MDTVLLVVHILSAVALVAIILLQRSEGGALSGLGGGNPVAGVMSTRGVATALTRTTAIIAVIFMVSSLLLASSYTKDNSAKTVIQEVEKPAVNDVPLAK